MRVEGLPVQSRGEERRGGNAPGSGTEQLGQTGPDHLDRPGRQAAGDDVQFRQQGADPARRAGTAVVEDRMDQEARTGGAGRIRTLLSELDVIAGSLPARPVEVVRAGLAELLGTRTGRIPVSALLAARLDGEPFDAHRLGLLSSLVTTLARTAPMPRPAFGDSWQWEAFFEAYFSNYIEGTEFGVDEARRIAIDGEIPVSRLTDPLHRAIAMMFLLTECHPFDDGNGRVARLLANAELSRAGQVRLIIPTVYRNNYLAALSGTSQGAGAGESLISTLAFAQQWTAAIDWSTYERARAEVELSNGFLDPAIGENSGRRLRLPA